MANSASCLVRNSEEVQKLAQTVGLDPTVAAAKIGTWLEQNEAKDFPSAEQFKEYLDSQKEVEQPIPSARQLSNSEILSQNFSIQERTNRVSLIAREFSNIVSVIKQTKRKDSTRQEIIQELGPINIFNLVKQRLQAFSEDPNKTTEQQDKLKKVLTFFTELCEETSPLLTRYENLMINPGNNNVKQATEKDSNTEDDSDLDNIQDSENQDGDTQSDVKDGWMIKFKFISPMESLSESTRRILMNIPKIGYDGNPEVDDLGVQKYIDPNLSHRILIEKLCNMAKPQDLIPFLQTLANSKPWVNNILSLIQEDKRLHSKFYQDFRKQFVSYWKQIRKVNPDGSFYYQTINLNKPDGYRYMMEDWRNAIESGSILTSGSVYNQVGQIDHTQADINKERVQQFRGLLTAKTNDETSKIVVDNVKELNDLLKGVGIDITDQSLLEALNTQPSMESKQEGVEIVQVHPVNSILGNLFAIYNTLGTNGRYKNRETLDLLNTFSKQYRPMAELLSSTSDQMIESSIHENGKSYYSFTAPCYALDIRNKIKDQDEARVQQFFAEQFDPYNWWFKYNSWIQDLKQNKGDRDLFDYKTDLNFNNTEYTKLKPLEYTLSLINNFYSSIDNSYAWYPQFILAEAPSGDFIKFKRISEFTHADWEEELLNKFADLAIQEYQRIKLVRNRQQQIREGRLESITNFDTKGLDFQFLPYLNDHKDLFDTIDLNDPASMDDFESQLKGIIRDHMDTEYQKELDKYKKLGLFEQTEDEKNLLHLQQFTTEESAREGLKNYFWNSEYATSQILQTFITDIAYFKDITDMQKRMKQIHTPGLKLDTTSKYGRETEHTIYLKDIELPSNNLDTIKEAYDTFVQAGYITRAEAEDAINKLSSNSITDAQALRSLSSYRAVSDMQGDWDESMDKLFSKIKAMQRGDKDAEGNPIKLTPEDYKITWQTIKPFMYTQTAVTGLVSTDKNGLSKDLLLKTPVQNKNSEYLLMFSRLLQISPQLQALEEFMEETKIDGNSLDLIQFTTAVKAGQQGAIDISDLTDKQSIKNRLAQAVYSIDPISGIKSINSQVVHSLSYNDYAIVQPMPNHYQETVQKIGTQIRKLGVSDISEDATLTIGKKNFNKQEFLKLYNDLHIENLLDSYYDIADRFSTIQKVADTLQSEVNSNSRYGPELKQALELIEDTNHEVNFALPLGDPVQSLSTQSMLHSILRNGVTKQKIKGGSLVQATSYGVSNKLNINFDRDSKGKLRIKEIECYMPWYSSEYLEPLMDKTNGMLDINAKFEDGKPVIPEDLKRLVAYRIPTEGKYSMLPLKIVGFLPANSGTNIILPTEITTLTGTDFDADKMYLMLPEFKYVNRYNRKQFVKELIEQQGEDSTDQDLVKRIKDLTYKESIAEDSSEQEKAIFNTWMANRQNYMLEQGIKKISYDLTKTPGDQSISARNNMMIDMIYSVLTNSDTLTNSLSPGTFDGLKRTARIANIFNGINREDAEAIEKRYNKPLYQALNTLTLSELSDLSDRYAIQLDPLAPSTQTYFHKANHTAGDMIGIIANHSVNHALLQQTQVGISKGYEFILNSKRYSNLNQIKIPGTNRYISKGLAQYIAAAVDAVKDPVFGDLNFNEFTMNNIMLLARLGHDHNTIGALMTQPIIKEMTDLYEKISRQGKSKTDAIDMILNKYEKEYGVTYPKDLLQKRFTVDSMYNNLITNNELDSLGADEINSFHQYQYEIGQLFSNIMSPAQSLADLTSIMRVDTGGGGSGPTQIHTNLKIDTAKNFMEKSTHILFPLTNANILNVDTLDPKDKKLLDPEASKDALRTQINQSKVPFTQAFYTLGLESSNVLFSDYYPYNKESFTEVVKVLNNLTKRSEFSKGSLSAKTIQNIYDDLLAYIGTELKFFGGDTPMESQDIRTKYINRFPDVFNKIMLDNPSLRENQFLNQLRLVRKEGEPSQIVFNNVGSLSQSLKDELSRNWGALLQGSKLERELAFSLFKYGFYRNGFRFGPNSFMHLAPTALRVELPGYREKYLGLLKESDNKNMYQRFNNQYLLNHRNNRRLVPEIVLDKTTKFLEDNTPREEVKVVIPKEKAAWEKDYVIRREQDRPILYPYIMKKDGGIEHYFEIVGSPLKVTQGYEVKYAPVKELLGIPNQFIEYSSLSDASDMKSAIPKDFKVSSEDDLNDILDPEMSQVGDSFTEVKERKIPEGKFNPFKKNSILETSGGKMAQEISEANKGNKQQNPDGSYPCG